MSYFDYRACVSRHNDNNPIAIRFYIKWYLNRSQCHDVPIGPDVRDKNLVEHFEKEFTKPLGPDPVEWWSVEEYKISQADYDNPQLWMPKSSD